MPTEQEMGTPLGVQLMDELFISDPQHYARIIRMDAAIEGLPLDEEAIKAIVASSVTSE